MTTLLHSFAALFCLVAAPLMAQDFGVPSAAFGVTRDGAGAHAGGPDYSARFDGRGVEFTPAPAAAAERPSPVRFTLDSVRRGASDVFVRNADVAPAVDGQQVRYVHRADLTEVYDVRLDGIEQSFVFATRPAGTGDLVVRGVITTQLQLAAATDDGVRYERDGLGGVTFGAVTGVDANGATARGSIRVADDGARVEWVLPAAFVDHCAYPLVLDPLIGSSFQIASFGTADSRPVVAFAGAQNRYLVVWRQPMPTLVDEIRGQFVGPTGGLLGSHFVLAASANLIGTPSIGYVRTTNRFLVAWTASAGAPIGFTSVSMASVSAATGSVSSTVVVASSPLGGLDEVRVGGDSRSTGVANEYACVVYRTSLGSIQLLSRGVHVTAGSNPILVGTPQVVTTGNVAYPSISKHCGNAGFWVVAWVHGSSGVGPWQNVSCRMIGDFGVPCSNVAQLWLGVAAAQMRWTTCATSNGNDFVVGWEDAVANRIRVRPVSFHGACPGIVDVGLTVSPVVVAGTQAAPTIDFAEHKYVLAWWHLVGGTPTLYAKGLDPDTCATCGAEHVVASGGVFAPDVVARHSGGDGSSDEALIVYANGTIRGRRFEAVTDDTVVAMGGGCGSIGFDNFATYNGDAVLGNLDFELALANPTLPVLALVIGLSNVSLPCGPCTLVPALDILAAGVTPSPLPIPCDLSYLGVDFYAQWLLYAPGGCPILPDFALSNALKFTIGE